MWELDHKEVWVPKNWCFWIVVVKTLESPLDSKIKPVNPKGNQSWIFIGITAAEAEVPILWPPDVKSWLGKDTDAGKDWERRRRGQQRMRWLDGIIDAMDMRLSKFREIVENRKPWCAAVHGSQSQTGLSKWTTTKTAPPGTSTRASACIPSYFSPVLTLCDPMNYSPPGNSVHGILQA